MPLALIQVWLQFLPLRSIEICGSDVNLSQTSDLIDLLLVSINSVLSKLLVSIPDVLVGYLFV